MKKAYSHQAAVLYGAKDLRLEQVTTQDPRPHQVQIAPRATGICGTDQHYYQNGRNGIYQIRLPLVLGHEAAGKVVAVGDQVKHVKVGDRVAVEPQISCMSSSCRQCRGGRYNLCPKMRFNGSASADPPAQGSLQRLWNHPADLCYLLPDSVSYEEGAMVEPLSVAIHSIRKAQPKAGQVALITGAGAIGLLCARIAKISGAATIIMVDVDGTRLEFAKKHKLADRTLKVPTSGEEGEAATDFAARMAMDVRKLLHEGREDSLSRRGFDYSLECTGVETCLNICIGASDPGARVVLVGMGRPIQQVNLGVALVREIEIIGVWRYTSTFQAAIDMIQAGIVDLKPMITHRFDLGQLQKALEYTLSRPSDLVKCVITSDRDD